MIHIPVSSALANTTCASEDATFKSNQGQMYILNLYILSLNFNQAIEFYSSTVKHQSRFDSAIC